MGGATHKHNTPHHEGAKHHHSTPNYEQGQAPPLFDGDASDEDTENDPPSLHGERDSDEDDCTEDLLNNNLGGSSCLVKMRPNLPLHDTAKKKSFWGGPKTQEAKIL